MGVNFCFVDINRVFVLVVHSDPLIFVVHSDPLMSSNCLPTASRGRGLAG